MTDVRLDDRGFTLGHGLFETVLWERHKLHDWDAHIARMARGCKALGLPKPDPKACLKAVDAAREAAGWPARAAIRLNWTAGSGDRGLDPPDRLQPSLTAHASEAPPPLPKPARLVTAKVRRNDRSPASRLKTMAYLDNVLARAEARSAGADEALMLNTRASVACAAAANVFWVRDERVFTPKLACGVLDGLVRAKVIAACRRLGVELAEVRVARRELDGAAMFITNSLVGVRAVAGLGGRSLPTDRVDALAADLR